MKSSINIKKKTEQAEALISLIATDEVTEKHWVTHYGANDIHPKHLVFWICVQTDKERDRLISDKPLMERLRNTLIEVDYPKEGRDFVFIGFESQETVDRESNGHWWHHWK